MKKLIPLLPLAFTLQSCNCKNGREGYEGDLIPIKAEANRIADYEKVVLLILKNKARLEERIKRHGDNSNYYLEDDSIDSYVTNDLKLRFDRVRLEIVNKVIAVVFDPEPADYYMRSNKKDVGACCTLFTHSIVYSEKPQKEIVEKDNASDAPYAVIKLKDRIYYRIYSRLEY